MFHYLLVQGLIKLSNVTKVTDNDMNSIIHPSCLICQGDQLELTTQTLRAELERQGRSLEASRRREEELEAELREATWEVESLARARDQVLLEASRLEHEKEECQSELDVQRKEGRQREREVARLRQQLESTNLALEHSNQRARALDAEHRYTHTILCTHLTLIISRSMQLTLQGIRESYLAAPCIYL